MRGRFGHRGLALAIAVTGLVAVMPYIALQLVGMQVVIAALGLDYPVTCAAAWAPVSLPLIAAFFVLAAFTYTSGLRGTALIAGGQGYPGLHHRAGGDHHHPVRAWRLWQDFRRHAGLGNCCCRPPRQAAWARALPIHSLAHGIAAGAVSCILTR